MAEPAVAERLPRFRRRKVLIQPWYQLRIAVTVLLFIVGYSLLLGFLMFYPLQQEFAATANPDQQFWIARQVLELHKRFWPAVLVVAVLVAAQSIFVTHRVVGPAYHIQRVMDGFAAGNYGMRVRLRRWDRLKELETTVNAVGEALVHREAAQREGTGRLQVALADLKAGIQGSSVPPGVQQALVKMEGILAKFPEPN
jgi:HAMP domain-containing protein